jgi:hypothetical protein
MSLRRSSLPDGSLDTLWLSSTRIERIGGKCVRWERALSPWLSPETGDEHQDEHRPLHPRALSLGLNPLPPQAWLRVRDVAISPFSLHLVI